EPNNNSSRNSTLSQDVEDTLRYAVRDKKSSFHAIPRWTAGLGASTAARTIREHRGAENSPNRPTPS
ncbi:MAG TPA: hypothetical protein VES69_16375, partial [Pyrinomonadaceae bacterium]|nr:hypothetical protein [Pyrinomonadaceae bacterium]